MLLFLLLLIAGCGGDLRDPTGLEGFPNPPGGGTGTTGGGGGGGGPTGSSALIGTWQAVFVIQLDTDVQRQTTTWSFGTRGSCHRTVEIFSVLADQTFTTESDCAFVVGAHDVTITYAGNTASATFQWSLANFSRDRLVLDGITYDRIH
ncbi:MAG: hypothetical protein ABI679_05445 [Gemmatimonadota bacterium]